MILIIYSFLFFFLTLVAWGVEMTIYQRKHLVDTWRVRERVQGRFTGAWRHMGRLDDGREVDTDWPALVCFFGFAMFCILGIAAIFI